MRPCTAQAGGLPSAAMSLLGIFRGWVPAGLRGGFFGLVPRAADPRVPLTLYTRENCPLCETMHRAIEAAGLGERIELLSIEVDSDPELVSRYGLEVPVLEIAGQKAFTGRLESGALIRAVDRAARALARGGH